MALQRVDAFRVAFDLDYASNLSDADWAAVVASPEWHILTAENADLLAPVLSRFSDKLSVYAQAQTLPPRPIPEGPFQIIGKPTPRVHGFGHVTGFGQYSEHMTQPAMLFMKTAGQSASARAHQSDRHDQSRGVPWRRGGPASRQPARHLQGRPHRQRAT
jgi:hypothetical protein